MSFDPHHKWLGIPPKEQPPHHYRLLGLGLFESDPDVIDAAANRQMAYVQSCATGKYIDESQQILNELSAARLCLLTPTMKQEYDAGLRKKLEQAVYKAVPVVAPPPLKAAVPALTDSKSNGGFLVAIAVIGVLVVIVGGWVMMRGGNPNDGAEVVIADASAASERGGKREESVASSDQKLPNTESPRSSLSTPSTPATVLPSPASTPSVSGSVTIPMTNAVASSDKPITTTAIPPVPASVAASSTPPTAPSALPAGTSLSPQSVASPPLPNPSKVASSSTPPAASVMPPKQPVETEYDSLTRLRAALRVTKNQGDNNRVAEDALELANRLRDPKYAKQAVVIAFTAASKANDDALQEKLVKRMLLFGHTSNSFSIAANKFWQPAGQFKQGDIVVIKAKGTWNTWPDGGAAWKSDGDGTRFKAKESFPLPGTPQGALIGKIGPKKFLVGKLAVIEIDRDGKLELMDNDDDRRDDNTGVLSVEISRVASNREPHAGTTQSKVSVSSPSLDNMSLGIRLAGSRWLDDNGFLIVWDKSGKSTVKHKDDDGDGFPVRFRELGAGRLEARWGDLEQLWTFSNDWQSFTIGRIGSNGNSKLTARRIK